MRGSLGCRVLVGQIWGSGNRVECCTEDRRSTVPKFRATVLLYGDVERLG